MSNIYDANTTRNTGSTGNCDVVDCSNVYSKIIGSNNISFSGTRNGSPRPSPTCTPWTSWASTTGSSTTGSSTTGSSGAGSSGTGSSGAGFRIRCGPNFSTGHSIGDASTTTTTKVKKVNCKGTPCGSYLCRGRYSCRKCIAMIKNFYTFDDCKIYGIFPNNILKLSKQEIKNHLSEAPQDMLDFFIEKRERMRNSACTTNHRLKQESKVKEMKREFEELKKELSYANYDRNNLYKMNVEMYNWITFASQAQLALPTPQLALPMPQLTLPTPQLTLPTPQLTCPPCAHTNSYSLSLHERRQPFKRVISPVLLPDSLPDIPPSLLPPPIKMLTQMLEQVPVPSEQQLHTPPPSL